MPAPDVGSAGTATVRLATPADVAGVAQSMSESFHASVWARIGGRSAEAYVSHFVRDPREFLVVAEHSTHGIVGACLSTMRMATHRRAILADGALRLGAALARDVVDPRVARTLGGRIVSGVVERIRSRARDTGPVEVEHLQPSWPLDVPEPGYIAGYFVSPRARGLQLAARMSRLAIDVFRRQAFEWCEVHTYTDNVASQTTALRAGFELVRREGTHLTYRRYLGEGEPGDIAIRIVEDVDAEPDLEREWATLLERTPDGSGFHAWGWIAAHLESVGRPRIGIVTLRGRPVAMFPLQIDGRERLRFLAERRSNYGGPVYDPEHLATVLAGFRGIVERLHCRGVDLHGLRERSPFQCAAAELVLGELGGPTVINTIGCPEVDLQGGWDAVWSRRKPKHRKSWRRAERKLAELGTLAYVELTSAQEIADAMPAAVRLYRARWHGLNVDEAFGVDEADFQRRAARALAPQGHAAMCVLQLDGEIIAFSYQLRANGVSSSYTLAHDDRYALFSPGQLLLIHVLEHAAERGDVMFDFSVGDEAYKDIWCTGRQELFRLVWGPGARRVALASSLRARLKSRPALRRLKQQGLRALVPPREPRRGPRWHLQRIEPAEQPDLVVAPMRLAQMRSLLDDEAFRIAIDRAFRGDDLLLLREQGLPAAVVWRAAPSRRALATGGLVELDDRHQVFVQPIALRDGADVRRILRGLGPGVLVSTEALFSPVLGCFEGDLR